MNNVFLIALMMVAGLHAAIATSLVAAAETGPTIAMTVEQQATLDIVTDMPQAVVARPSRNLPARVMIPPGNERVLSPLTAGVIESVQVAVGDRVEQGQVLATIRSVALAGLQKDYLQALNRQKLASTAYRRDKQLVAEGIVASQRLLNSEADLAEANALVEERRLALELVGMNAADIRELASSRHISSSLPLKASVGGVVLDQMAHIGEAVDPSQALFRLADLSRLWLAIQAPVELASQWRPGEIVRVNELATGELQLVGRQVEPGSQTVTLRAVITEGVERLRPGQIVQAQIGTADTLLAVPAGALTRVEGRSYVFVQTPGGFLPRAVQVAGREDGRVLIGDGLHAGEAVAVSNIAAIKGAWQGMGGAE